MLHRGAVLMDLAAPLLLFIAVAVHHLLEAEFFRDMVRGWSAEARAKRRQRALDRGS